MAERISYNKQDLRNGVTGIIRCRNHAAFLRLCIDSCIDALDEIIAIYHDSTDDTEAILMQYNKKYPEKFIVIRYENYVFPLDMDISMYEFAIGLSPDSPYLFSGYTNYALEHASHKWILRIDADQIYFSERLKTICDSFRRGVGNIKSYYSGINLFEKDNRWLVCTGKPTGFYPLFNGYGDHFLHPNTENKKYIKYSRLNEGRKQRLTEVFPIETSLIPGGFLWFHVKNLLPENLPATKEMLNNHLDSFIELPELVTNDFKRFSEKYKPSIPFEFADNLYKIIWDQQKLEIPWQMLDKIMDKHKTNLATTKIVQSSDEYFSEFNCGLKVRLDTFINEFGSQMNFGDIDLSPAVRLLLSTHLENESSHYIDCRSIGMLAEASFSRVDKFLELFSSKEDIPPINASISNPMWEQPLEPLKGCILVYADQSSTLQLEISKLYDITEPVLLVSLDDFPETDVEVPDNFSALQLHFTHIMIQDNPYLRKFFPYINKYANSFSWLLSLTRPKQVIVCPTDSIENTIMQIIIEAYKIPSTIILS